MTWRGLSVFEGGGVMRASSSPKISSAGGAGRRQALRERSLGEVGVDRARGRDQPPPPRRAQVGDERLERITAAIHALLTATNIGPDAADRQ